MSSPERQRVLQHLTELLMGLTVGAMIVVRPEGVSRKRAWEVPWPGPGGLFEEQAAPAADDETEEAPKGPGLPACVVTGADYEKVAWPGAGAHLLNRQQRAVVSLLVEAWEDGTIEVSQAALLRAAGVSLTRLVELFRTDPGKSAWGRLIVPGKGAGTYRLPEPPEVE